MAGKFSLKKFSEINLKDAFFDSLKKDYPADTNNIGFENWFKRKANEGSTALVFDDEIGLGAFICLKNENEEINLQEGTLKEKARIKISTFRIAERFRNQRIGEGALGLALWKWQKTKSDEIYVTVFDKHILLINQLERFGFQLVGHNLNGEKVYIKSRLKIDYSNPYKSFPFIDPAFSKAGYLIVNDDYHDTLFPYSELAGTYQESLAISVANGLSKIYIGSASSPPHYKKGEPIFIYRRHSKKDGLKPRYKSCLTSYCIVNDVIQVKNRGKSLMTFDQFKSRISNKSVFDEDDIREKYNTERNLIAIEMLYYGYFGAGNNINMDWLDRNGLWAKKGEYPTEKRLSPEQFKTILKEGKIDVSNVIIN